MCQKNSEVFSVPHLDICITEEVGIVSKVPIIVEASSVALGDLRVPCTSELRGLFEAISKEFHGATEAVADDTLFACSMEQAIQITITRSSRKTEALSEVVLFEQTRGCPVQGKLMVSDQSEDEEDISDDCSGREEELEMEALAKD